MEKRIYTLLLTVIYLILAFSCALRKEYLGGENNIEPQSRGNNTVSVYTYNSVKATSVINDSINVKIDWHGWVWNFDTLPVIFENMRDSILLSNTTDDSTRIIKDLQWGAKYYFRRYLIGGAEVAYGNDISVTMGIPKLDILKDVSPNGSICTKTFRCTLSLPGNLKNEPIIDYGVRYRKTDLPLTALSGDWVDETTDKSISGMDFQVTIDKLEPGTNYSFQAYAATKYGTGYGSQDTISIPATNLKAEFTINTDHSIFAGARVKFTNNSSPETANFSWDFGNGSVPFPVDSTYTYPDPNPDTDIDIFIVKLTATDGGCVSLMADTLYVEEDPFDGYFELIGNDTFWMGCNTNNCYDDNNTSAICEYGECERHQVYLDSFWMGKWEVSQSQWMKVMNGDNPSTHIHLNNPVETVTWDDVNNFIIKLIEKTGLNYSLPTEAQWEYAARGGSETKEYSGSNSLLGFAWCNSDIPRFVKVGAANGYGLLNMSGNVEEWCKDAYNENFYKNSYINENSNNPLSDTHIPSNPLDYVIRGGSFSLDSTISYSKKLFRVSSRFHDVRGRKLDTTGFRLVKNQ